MSALLFVRRSCLDSDHWEVWNKVILEHQDPQRDQVGPFKHCRRGAEEHGEQRRGAPAAGRQQHILGYSLFLTYLLEHQMVKQQENEMNTTFLNLKLTVSISGTFNRHGSLSENVFRTALKCQEALWEAHIMGKIFRLAYK